MTTTMNDKEEENGPKTQPSEVTPTLAPAEDKHKGVGPKVLQKFEQIAEDFWPQVEKTDCCWIWHGPCEKGHGLPRFHLSDSTDWGPKYVAGHHVAWLLETGKLPKPGSLRRICDNKLCVRPKHWVKQQAPKRYGSRKNKEKKAEAKPAPQPVARSADGATVEAPLDHASTLLAAVASELRTHAVAQHNASTAVLGRIDTLGRALLALRDLVADRRPTEPLQPDPKRLSAVEQRLAAIERSVSLTAEDVAGLRRDVSEALQRQATPVPVEPAEPEPAERSLREVLCLSFEAEVGVKLDPQSLDGAYLDDVLDLALRECDAEGPRAGRTFERWVRWYGALVRRAEDGQGPEPTPEGFLKAVSADETRPPPCGEAE